MFSPSGQFKEIKKVESENLSYILKIRELEYLEKDNIRLRKALSFKENSRLNLIGAEVISFDPSSWRRIITINLGDQDGVEKGLYAIDENGWFIGKVVNVKKHYAQIMLVNDPDFSLPVFVGSRLMGLMKGGLSGVTVLYIDEAGDLKEKDKVWVKVASLASPIYLGEVSRVYKNDDDLFWNIKVNLFSENPFLHKVFLVK